MKVRLTNVASLLVLITILMMAPSTGAGLLDGTPTRSTFSGSVVRVVDVDGGVTVGVTSPNNFRQWHAGPLHGEWCGRGRTGRSGGVAL